MKKYYLLTVSCGDPEVYGPYKSDEARDRKAKRMVRAGEVDPVNDDANIFALNVENGKPKVYAYPGDFFEE
jgi:hypothetical protein